MIFRFYRIEPTIKLLCFSDSIRAQFGFLSVRLQNFFVKNEYFLIFERSISDSLCSSFTPSNNRGKFSEALFFFHALSSIRAPLIFVREEFRLVPIARRQKSHGLEKAREHAERRELNTGRNRVIAERQRAPRGSECAQMLTVRITTSTFFLARMFA